MGKKVRLTNDRLNSYGLRVLTEGVDITQYERNPILLYMHNRGSVIGKVTNIRKENDEIVGELEFDEVTELSRNVKQQFEFGSLNMVSAGIDIIETSENAQYLVPGQTGPTVTASRLYEVSVVDVGANDDAIVLRYGGKLLQLGRDGYSPLPLKTDTKMERKTLCLLMGLPETADENAVQAKIKQLMKDAREKASLQAKLEQLQQSTVTSAVDVAIREGRLQPGAKEHFINLGKQIGLEPLKATLSAMMPAARVSEFIGDCAGGMTSYRKLSEVPADELETIRRNDIKLYKRLYKAEYGEECKID